MAAASGKKRTPRHEGVTEGRGGNGRNPLPPIPAFYSTAKKGMEAGRRGGKEVDVMWEHGRCK